MVNNLEAKLAHVQPIQDQKMLIKNWQPVNPNQPSLSSEEGYKWEFFLYDRSEGSLISPDGKGAPDGKYGDLYNISGIAGQNTATPAEKVFGNHVIVEIPQAFLPQEYIETPYFDPSYGVTYCDEADFERQAVYGYAKLSDKQELGKIIYKVREIPVPNNISFTIVRY